MESAPEDPPSQDADEVVEFPYLHATGLVVNLEQIQDALQSDDIDTSLSVAEQGTGDGSDQIDGKV